MPFLVMSGTGTDVGKTIATAVVVKYLSNKGIEVLPIKPVQTGEKPGSGDIFSIEKLTGIKGKEWVRFRDPLAPNLAAAQEGAAPVDPPALIAWLKQQDAPHRLVVIEGAGGLLVRLAAEFSIADVAAELNAPLLIVTSTGLGSLNAAELTVEAARHRGLEVIGLIGGSISAKPDLATRLNLIEFERTSKVPFIGAIPQGAGALNPEEFSELVAGFNFPVLDLLHPVS